MERKLKDDIVKHAREIGDYINESERRAFYLLENGLIPGFKIGDIWHSRKSQLDKHYSADNESPPHKSTSDTAKDAEAEADEAAAQASDQEASEDEARRREDGEDEEADAETPEAA